MHISSKKFIALLAGIFLLAVGTAALIYRNRPAHPQVLVTVNGRVYGTYDLYEDQTVCIAPPDNAWHNTLTIHDGKAAVVESDCSNQICVFTPPLTEDTVGIIVCLPHGVAVELTELKP